jgi:hypothetical protein
LKPAKSSFGSDDNQQTLTLGWKLWKVDDRDGEDAGKSESAGEGDLATNQ